MENKKFIEVKDLQKTYDNGHQAIKSVSFSVNKGELVCLLGPSGCGKTTTLNMIAGLLAPTGGDILVEGKSMIHVEPKDRNIGYVFQNYALYPHMTVLQNVMFPLTVGKGKKSKNEAKKIAKRYMQLTHIEELADQKPGKLSGGQQQRVAIARALVQEPKILLMDEPLSNLDARLRLKIREEIRALVKEVGITTLFVTHDQEEALSIGDRIILFNEGTVQQNDTGDNLYLEPVNQFVANFIGNPVIDNFKVKVENNYVVGKGFKFAITDLKNERFKKTLHEGQTYTLSVRPENLLPLMTEVKIENDDHYLEADIEDIELIGRERVLKFTNDGISERSLINLEHQVKRGDHLTFSFKLKRVYIFDDNGERVY